MTDRPANYIEFDTLPDTVPANIEASYIFYHGVRSAGNPERIEEFLSLQPNPAEFLKGYEEWQKELLKQVEQVDGSANAWHSGQEPAEPVEPANPHLPMQGMGGIPHNTHNFPVYVMDEQGRPTPDGFGGFLIKRDRQGNKLYTDGMGNVVLNDDRGTNDAAHLFGKRKDGLL